MLVLMGLLAELITRTYHESQHKRTYAIRTRLRGGEEVRERRNGQAEREPEPVVAAARQGREST